MSRNFSDKSAARAAYDKEIAGLVKIPKGLKTGVLTRLRPGDPEYDQAVQEAQEAVFCDDTAYNSRLKHIDCRQWSVRLLRDKSFFKPSGYQQRTTWRTYPPKSNAQQHSTI